MPLSTYGQKWPLLKCPGQNPAKGHTPGKWRLITDLSYPPNASVNDGIIDPALCTLSYVTVDVVADQAACLGKGSLMSKTDIESAYGLVPVYPCDRPLQAVQ